MSEQPELEQMWERQPEESLPAFAAFRDYLQTGENRSLIGLSRRLPKAYSLLRRWAKQHHWEARVRAWERNQRRQEYLRQQSSSEAVRQRAWEDAEQIRKVAKAGILRLVRQDPVTGQISLDESVKHRDSIALYRLALEIRKEYPASPDDPSPTEELAGWSGPELRTFMQVVQERTRKEDQHDPDSL